jgi:hypothetical protein
MGAEIFHEDRKTDRQAGRKRNGLIYTHEEPNCRFLQIFENVKKNKVFQTKIF